VVEIEEDGEDGINRLGMEDIVMRVGHGGWG
jgi:hypothetical protein